MGWESFGVVRFDLGPLLQGQTSIAKLNSAYNSLSISLVRTHHGDAENFNSYFIFVSDRHYIHIFHILLMVICLFTDIIS